MVTRYQYAIVAQSAISEQSAKIFQKKFKTCDRIKT